MSRLHSMKVFVRQRLTAAVDEILGHLEYTITEYEEEMEGRHRKLLHAVSNPEQAVQLHSLIKEEQQEWSPGLDGEDPVRQHIKEEQDDLLTGPEVGSQLPGLQEEDVLEFPLITDIVKSEEVEEKPQFFPLHQRQNEDYREAEPPASSSAEQIKTDADGEDCGGSEPDRVLEPGFKCLSGSAGKTSQCSGAVTEDSDDDRKKIRKPQTDLSIMKKIVPVSKSNMGHSCSTCGKRCGQKHQLLTHMRCHTGEKPFSCSLCGKRFSQKGNLTQHLPLHTREKPCSCPVCGERFAQKGHLTQHMTVHKRENFVGERLTKGFYETRMAFVTKNSVDSHIRNPK